MKHFFVKLNKFGSSQHRASRNRLTGNKERMYTHQPLSREKAEIRLLSFLPTSTKQEPVASLACGMLPLKLKLEHASLADSPPTYVALSYVWGGDPESQDALEIEINGAPFPVTRSLFDTLHRTLARMEKRRSNTGASWLPVWVDAICINQSDLAEKGWQVAQMRDVYATAECTYMMLGPGTPATDRAMDFISDVGQDALSVGALDMWPISGARDDVEQYIRARPPWLLKPARRRGETGSWPGDSPLSRLVYDVLNDYFLYSHDEEEEKDAIVNSVGAGLQQILGLKYWERVWIVQEVAVAVDAMVICGSRAVPIDVFEAIMHVLFSCRQSGLYQLVPQYHEFLAELDDGAYDILSLRTRRQVQRHSAGRGPGVRLVDLLVQSRVQRDRPYFVSTNPLDVVYALLGVVSNSSEVRTIPIDYNLSRAQVFTNACRAMLGDVSDGRVFSLDSVVPRTEDSSSSDLPSWVPDWEQVGKAGRMPRPIVFLCRGQADACAGLPRELFASLGPDVTPEEEWNTLRISGCYVDVITEVMARPTHDPRPNLEQTEAYLAAVARFCHLGPDASPGEDYVWRTVLCNQYSHVPGQARPQEAALSLVRKVMRRPASRDGYSTLTPQEIHFLRNGPFELAYIGPFYSGIKTEDQRDAYLWNFWRGETANHAAGRTLFRTVKGLLGLGHAQVRAGDMVALFPVVSTPIVLRPVDAATAHEGPRADAEASYYTLLGDAYVDGIMQGEFIATRPSPRRFVIV